MRAWSYMTTLCMLTNVMGKMSRDNIALKAVNQWKRLGWTNVLVFEHDQTLKAAILKKASKLDIKLRFHFGQSVHLEEKLAGFDPFEHLEGLLSNGSILPYSIMIMKMAYTKEHPQFERLNKTRGWVSLLLEANKATLTRHVKVLHVQQVIDIPIEDNIESYNLQGELDYVLQLSMPLIIRCHACIKDYVL